MYYIPHNVGDIPALKKNHLASPHTMYTAKRNPQLNYWYDKNIRKAQFCDRNEKIRCKKLQDVQNLGEDTVLY